MKQLDFFAIEEEGSLNLISEKAIHDKEEYCCYECKHLNPVSWDEIKGISGTCNFRETVFLGTEKACYKFINVREKERF